MKVLFLVAGGLQLGALACYGNQRLVTSTLDSLAADGIVFDQHQADVPTADGARRSWRTGRHGFGSAAQAGPDLLQILRDEQVTTARIAQPPFCTADHAGWDHLETLKDRAEKRLVTAVRKVLTRLKKADRLLLRVELAGLLLPWEIPAELLDRQFANPGEPEDEDGEPVPAESLEPLTDPAPGLIDPNDDTTFLRLQRTCGAAVEQLDDLLGQLLDLDGLDEFLVLLTSDRGYPLGEHGLVGEVRPWLYEERVHLPLIVRRPDGAEAGLRVSSLTQPVDLPATLLDAFGLPVPPDLHGRSLWPALHGSPGPVREYACSVLQVEEAVEYALRTPEWQFVLPVQPFPYDPPRRPQLYVKPDDRWEVNDLIQHNLELAETLELTLRGFVEAARQPGPLQPPKLLHPALGGTRT